MTLPSDPSSPHITPPPFGRIIIGDEILSGKRVDKHLPKVAELLSTLTTVVSP